MTTPILPNLQTLFAQRIGGVNYGVDTPIYKFEKIKRAKAAARAAHPDIPLIDLGVGEPDANAPREAIDILYTEALKPENRGYADNGDDVLKHAAARFLKNVCGVSDINPDTDIIHSIGTKAALSILPAAFINPGDIALMTTPGYPVFGTHARYYGGQVHNLPLTKQNNYLPDLDSVPPDILRRAKVLVLNYPNNPTGACANPEFFRYAVEWALRHNILLIHDFAYAALMFDEPPLSILSIPDAKEICLELHSASKNFNMTGWRCGFVVGHPRLVRAYGDVKDNTDSGQYLPIQHAVAWCFDHPEITRAIAQKYSRRMDLLVPALRSLGFQLEKPRGGFFLYAPAPRAATTANGNTIPFPTAEDFSQWLITEKLISTVPWDDAGAYVRFSVTYQAPTEADERAITDEILQRLSDITFHW